MFLLLLRPIATTQMCIAALLMLATAPTGGDGWQDVLIAWAVSMLYTLLGLIAGAGGSLKMLVVRHVFRCLVVGMLLVVAPLLLLGRVSPLTLGAFVVVHALSWWWVFGRRYSPWRHLLLGVSTPPKGRPRWQE